MPKSSLLTPVFHDAVDALAAAFTTTGYAYRMSL
jgi:hypothetical protein